MAVYDEVFLDGTPYPVIPAGTTVVNVSTSAALSTALSNAAPGHRIVLADGSYSGSFAMSGKVGTSSAGISIEAANVGGATFASTSTWRITNCSYVTVSGLEFPFDVAGDLFPFRGTSQYCRVTRCTFGPTLLTSSTDVANWVFIGDDCQHIRVDDNLFRNKGTSGPAVWTYGSSVKVQAGQGSSAGCPWVRTDHNSFVGVDEPVRYGDATMSRTIANGVIERNVFADCVGGSEIVSVEMGGIRATGNTVLRCAGGLVVRHGTNSLVADNYVVDRAGTTAASGLQSGGVRFYDADHTVAFNYIEATIGVNLQDPLLLDTGDAEGSSTNLSAHWRVIGAMVERNVLVDVPRGITIGDNYSSVPRDCTVRHNLVVDADTGTAITQRVAPSNSVLEPGNLYFATTAKAGMTAGPDSIWRKAGYGPRLTYLDAGAVGPTTNIGDTDGTGAEVGGAVAVPADVLNIGLDEGQNHFRLRYAANGASAVSNVTLDQVASGFAVNPYFRAVDGTSTPGTVESFGKETDGASSTSSSTTKLVASSFSPSAGGTLTAGHARAWLDVAGSTGSRVVVYADSAGAPAALLATSDEVAVTNTAEAAHDYTFSGANRITLTSGTPYWLGLMWDDPGTPALVYSRDNTSSLRVEQTGFTYPTPPDPFGTIQGPFNGPIDVWLEFETPETPGDGGATAVQFQVRADGAITGGSSFPRSELRETRRDGADMAFDAMVGDHALRTKARITHLPAADPEVIVAALHDGTTEQVAIRTQQVLDETKLLVWINGAEAARLSEAYLVDEEFDVRIQIRDGGLVEVYYRGSSAPLVSAQLVSTGGATWYWNVGAHAQFDAASAGSSTEYVTVEHRDLQVTHSPPRVDAGSDAQVVTGQVFSRTALEPGITGVVSRRWTIVSRPTTSDPDPDPGDQQTAAARHGWGTPRPESDEFAYTGTPDPNKWALPGADWAGHAGNGRRRPERQTVTNGKLVMTGLANGDSGWMRHKLDRQYGRWEVRCRSFGTATSNGNDYHPVLLIWPTSNSRQNDGEYDFHELGEPGKQSLVAFMHYPHPGTSVVQQERFEKFGVDMSQWHNIGFEWTPDHLRGYIDGEVWFTVSGGANSVRRDIQTMPSGHGNIQLDNFDGTNQTPATFEVEWYRVYDYTPPTGGVPVGANTLFEDGFSAGSAWPTDDKYSSVNVKSSFGGETVRPASAYDQSAGYALKVGNYAGRTNVARFEVRDGDISLAGERCEVTLNGEYDVHDGDERWYEWDLRLGDPIWNRIIDSSGKGTVIFQWHAGEGSPPLALRASPADRLRFTFENNQPPIDFWTIRSGVWERIVLHVKFSNNSSVGFVEVHVNGELVVPKTFRRTMKDNDSYHKFGIYRADTDNTVTSVVMYDSIRISSGPAVVR